MVSKIKSLLKLIKYLLFHRFPRLKKVYKQSSYKDLSKIIIDINFSIILDFWYEQIKKSDFDWTQLPQHQEFYNWIEETVNYIENERPLLLNKMNSYLEDAVSHSEATEQTIKLYEEYRNLSNDLRGRDTIILNEMIKQRTFFWT